MSERMQAGLFGAAIGLDGASSNHRGDEASRENVWQAFDVPARVWEY